MKDQKPGVSVIMSTHNRAKDFLPKAIESVLNQAYLDFELIIIDDASTDNTKEVVESYQKKDSRVRYLRLDENFGCDTRPKNIGIQAALADWVAFLDDDCQFRPDHLAVLKKTLDRNPGIHFVYGDRWIVPTEKMQKEGMKPQVGVYSEFDPFLLMSKNYIDTSDVMVRRDDLLAVGGFDEKIRKFIDWNLWVRLAKRGKLFKRVSFIITDYYLHDQMKSVLNKEGQFNPVTGLFTPTFDPINCEIHCGSIGKPVPQKVGIFTLLFNRLFYTQQMFQSILDTVRHPIDKWVLVDQGSNDGTVDWVKRFAKENNIPLEIVGEKKFEPKGKNKSPIKRLFLILNKENTGIPYASNQALDLMDPQTVDYIAKIDNDAKFLTKGWLEGMMDIYTRNEMMCLSPYIEGLVAMPGAMPRMVYGTIGDEFLGMVTHLGGICTMSPAKIYYTWRWPASSFMQGGNDVLFCSYAQRLGYQLAFMENHRVLHNEGTGQQEKRYPEYFKNKEILRRSRYIPKE